MSEPLLMRYLQPLLAGRRADCFQIVGEALQGGSSAESILTEVICPSLMQVERLFRSDRINAAAENMACRINRTVADQLQVHLPTSPKKGRRALLYCADEVREEVGAQIVADLLQADGWEVYFVGSGVPRDEILALVGHLCPHALVIFGTQPRCVPEVRRLVEMIREIGICPTMNVLASGGIFDRADGLWQEVGADAFAETARDVRRLLNELGPRVPTRTRPIGLVKKRRRRRRESAQPVTS